MNYRIIVTAAAALLGACEGGPKEVFGCSMELSPVFTPRDTTVSVGQRFTAHLDLFSCQGADHLTDTFTWSVQDSSVVTIDKQTGVVTAVGVGQTHLFASGATYGLFDSGLITVR